MKTITSVGFGNPLEVLKIIETNKPLIKEDEILIKVMACGVNYADSGFITGKPFLLKLMSKATGTKVFGAEVSGVIYEVGNKVTQFKIGDEVYADLADNGFGGFAEFAVAKEKIVVLKPKNLSFIEAAAVPQSAVVALQGLRNYGQIKSGDNVLINGASGGIGSFAIQIAKYYGANVTAVCSSNNTGFVKNLGADSVIDYTKVDFRTNGVKYDLILDMKAEHFIKSFKNSLTENGKYILVGGKLTRLFQSFIFGNKKMFNFLAKVNQEDLNFVRQLIESGKLKSSVGIVFHFNQTAEAINQYINKSTKGKIVIDISNSL